MSPHYLVRPLSWWLSLLLLAGCQDPAVDRSPRIHEIQGAGHRSPLAGLRVEGVPGIVTAVRGNGFIMQDPQGDADIATSEGVLVFTGGDPQVRVGDSVRVAGLVKEYYGRGEQSGGLSITELVEPSVEVLERGQPLPAPVVVGRGGRVPPRAAFSLAEGNVEESSVFNPVHASIDFFESLEFMRVQVNDAVVVGPTTAFGELVVVADRGMDAGPRTPRGGLIVEPGEFHPERIVVSGTFVPLPKLNVGDRITTPLVGIIDYSFGNYKLHVTEPIEFESVTLARMEVEPAAEGELSIATFNVENFHALEPPERVRALARQIVVNLASPDLLGLQEVSDNNGPLNDDVVDASETLRVLCRGIRAQGGPEYEFRQIDPLDDQDGGRPGDNIRVAFLYRTDRGLEFVDRGQGDAVTPTEARLGKNGVYLSHSPGRLEPDNPAFAGVRKSLAGEFRWQGHTLLVVNNHLSSKLGDQPLAGRFQPPQRPSETARHGQAQLLNDFVAHALDLDPQTHFVVLGDLNDFWFSVTARIACGDLLESLMERLPANERYTYVYEGNSQQLDHILITHRLAEVAQPRLHVVHANAEFADQDTDHDPLVLRLRFKPQ